MKPWHMRWNKRFGWSVFDEKRALAWSLLEEEAKVMACAPEMAEMLRWKVLAALSQPQAMDIDGVIEDIHELLQKAGVL